MVTAVCRFSGSRLSLRIRVEWLLHFLLALLTAAALGPFRNLGGGNEQHLLSRNQMSSKITPVINYCSLTIKSFFWCAAAYIPQNLPSDTD